MIQTEHPHWSATKGHLLCIETIAKLNGRSTQVSFVTCDKFVMFVLQGLDSLYPLHCSSATTVQEM